MGNEAIQDTQIVETPKIGRRKRKKPYSSMTITTGDIGLNIDRFNAAFGSTEGSEVGVGGGCATGEVIVSEDADDDDIRLEIMNDLYEVTYTIKEEK